MKRITTNKTLENFTFPVSFADVSATIAGLASVMTIDEDYFLANHLSLVLNKTEELFCTPASNELSGLLACFSFPLHISCSQNFKGNSITILVNDCFTDAVVGISDEPSLSTTKQPKMSLSTSSACSLKATLQIFVSAFDLSKFFAIEKSVIGCDCWMIDSSINTNNLLGLSEFGSVNFDYDVNENSSFLRSDSCRFRSFEIILRKITGNLDRVFFSSIDCADAHNLGIRQKPKSIVIEPYATILLFSGLNLELETLEHITCLVSDSSHETTIEFWMSLSDKSISELMKPCLIECVGFHSSINTFLTSLITQLDCVSQVIVSDDFSSDCNIHNNPLKHNLFKYVVFLCSNENQKIKTYNLQHQLSFGVVSEVSKESFDWSSQGFSREDNQRSMRFERLGAYQSISSTRPSTRFYFCTPNLQPDVYCESFEGGNSSESCEDLSFCKQVLESELLCWNGRNSYGTDYSEVYFRTGTHEVNERQFPTATRLQCPLVA
jgi:hypothetical protein